jgi:adenylate cyclase
LWVGAQRAFARNLLIPVVPPGLAFLATTGLVTLYSAVTGRRDRSAMMQLIGHYVSDDVAKLIWSERDDVFSKGRLRTRRLRGTVLFTDLKGFSTISEQLKAQDLMRWLNEYFRGISDLVKQTGGIIMKFNGDQIVAVFGPPRRRTLVESGVDARNAVRCAIHMREQLVKLNAGWALRNKPQAAMRIGIHTGWLVAGSLGSRQRMEWTVIGDTVNTAARLESLKKDLMPEDIAAYGCRILISDGTAKLLDLGFDLRRLGKLKLKGKHRRVLVYGVKGFAGAAASSTRGDRAALTVTTAPVLVQKKDG